MTGLAAIFSRLAKAASVRCGLGALLLTTSCSAMAADNATENTSWWQRTTDAALAKAEKINAQGETTLLLSGYSYHGRNTYTSERISEFNEKSWGAGIGKILRHPNGNEEYLYGMAISDSHYDPQFMAGYAYQWVWPIAGPLEIGAGWTALLISRTDILHGVPFPIALPLMSIGTPDAKLMASYIPRLSSNKGNGDVLYIFGRIHFN